METSCIIIKISLCQRTLEEHSCLVSVSHSLVLPRDRVESYSEFLFLVMICLKWELHFVEGFLPFYS